MIARVWRGIARPEKANDYVEHLRRAVFPELHQIAGFREAFVLRRNMKDGNRWMPYASSQVRMSKPPWSRRRQSRFSESSIRLSPIMKSCCNRSHYFQRANRENRYSAKNSREGGKVLLFDERKVAGPSDQQNPARVDTG
jgi:hypothetical protein